MSTIHRFSRRGPGYLVVLLCAFCFVSTNGSGQVIGGVDVLTLVSGEGITNSDITGISSVVLDSTNQRLICVYNTSESDLPTTDNAYQQRRTAGNTHCAYLAVYDLVCKELIYGSYLSGGRHDIVNTMCRGASANEVIIAGSTQSMNFPVTADAYQRELSGDTDVWYARFNIETFQFTYITFLGGNLDETCANVLYTKDGSLLISGSSYSFDLPKDPRTFTREPEFNEIAAAVFVLKDDDLSYVVLFGGTGGAAFEGLYETDDAYVFVGETYSRDILVTANAFQVAHGGGQYDMFIMRCDKEFRKVQYCTYLGGRSQEFIHSIRQQGNRIHIVGNTWGETNFPVTHQTYEGKHSSVQALYVIYDASTDEIPFSGLFGGKDGGTIPDIAFVEDQKVILNMVTASDSIYGVVKAPPGDPSNAMELLIEFDLKDYQITHVHYPWNAYIGYSYMQFLPSSFGWYIYGAVGGQVPVNPEGMRTEFTGIQDAYIGRIFRNTNSATEPESPTPRLLTITPYPNPAIGETTVVLFGPRGEYTLRLYDTAGRLQMERRFEHGGATATNLALPLSGLAPGRYQLVANDAAGKAVASTGVVRY